MPSDGSTLRKVVAGVVGLAALLLATNVVLALMVTRRSRRIREGLERLRETTADLRRAPELSGSLEEMNRYLQVIRRGEVN